jgi:hypothetical protein
LQNLIFVLIIAALFAASSSMQFVHAEEIPSHVENKIRLWTNNQADSFDFLQAIHDLNGLGLLEFQPRSADSIKNTYFLPAYGSTKLVEIEGRSPNIKQTNPVLLVITKPDGSELELNSPVLESGAYSTILALDHSSPLGVYKIVVYHSGKEIKQDEFYLVKSNSIPFWIKNVSRWWIEEKISDMEFLDGLDYLIKNNIIVTFGVADYSEKSSLDVTVDGHKAVRRGTTQNISIHVTNTDGPVTGATVFVHVEDYGEEVFEDIFEEFEGVTDSEGNYNVSWEISKDFPNLKTFLVYVDVTDGISSQTKVFKFEVYCLCGEANCECRN